MEILKVYICGFSCDSKILKKSIANRFKPKIQSNKELEVSIMKGCPTFLSSLIKIIIFYRSTSPKTISWVPIIATTSAKLWFFAIGFIAEIW